MTKKITILRTGGLAVLTTLLATVFYPGVTLAQTDPSSPDSVSVMDDLTADPSAVPVVTDPAVTTDMAQVPPEGTPVPVGPEDTVAATGIVPVTDPATTAVVPVDDFPPQPVSVAPAEEGLPIPPADLTPMPAVSADATSAPMPQDPLEPSVPFDATQTPQQGVASGGNPLGDTGARQQHSGSYYDSHSLVPDRDLAKAGATGPRKVDPVIEPGQKFVTVQQGASAGSYEGQYVAATRALKLGRYAAAMEMFEGLHQKNSRDSRVLMGLAVAQQGAGFTESASRSYEDLLNVQPNNADAIVNLMGIMKGQYPSVTLQRLMELRGKYPTNPGVPAQIGLINAEMKNYDDAMRYLEIAATMQPTNSSHLYNMAIVADHKGDIHNAIKYYERALELDSTYGDAANTLPRDAIFDRLSALRRKA